MTSGRDGVYEDTKAKVAFSLSHLFPTATTSPASGGGQLCVSEIRPHLSPLTRAVFAVPPNGRFQRSFSVTFYDSPKSPLLFNVDLNCAIFAIAISCLS